MLEKSSLLLLVAVCTAGFMNGLDGSIINICLPLIAEVFGVDTGTVSWVAIAYLLMVAGTVFIFGNIAGNGHIKKLLIIGYSIFTISSLFCGFSDSFGVLIGTRLIQGIGASMVIACAPMLCVKHLPSNILGFSLGLLAAATSVAYAIGPAIGGLIVKILSWNWIFWINIPIGIFAILYVCLVIPKDRSIPNPEKFDFRGAILIFITMAVGIFTIERLPHLGFSSPQILVGIGITIAAALGFCYVELKSKKPLINIRVFKFFSVNAVLFSFLIFQVLYCGFFYILPFYFSTGLSMDTLFSGFLLLIPPAIMILISVPISKWSDRTGRRWFCVVTMILLTIICIIYAIISPTWNIGILILILVLMGIDYGLASGPGASRVVEIMPEKEREMGSSLMISCIYLGAVLGTALYAACFTLFTSMGNSVLSFSELSVNLFMDGFHRTMIVAAIIAAVGIILAFVVRDKKFQKDNY